MLRIKTSLIMKIQKASLAPVSLSYNLNALEAISMGLIKCFKIAKVTPKQIKSSVQKLISHWEGK
jgi:hypothetical protein